MSSPREPSVTPGRAASQTEAQMLDTVLRYLDAYNRRSLDECLACFEPSEALMLYGTEGEEKRIGIDAMREQLRSDFSQIGSGNVRMTWHTKSAREDMGWVAADAIFTFQTAAGKQEAPVRMTFVLERDEGGLWRIVHGHNSWPGDGSVLAGSARLPTA